MGNHIITLALQAHNGEQCEPHNSKLKTNRKRENFSAINRFVLSSVVIRVWAWSLFVFDRSNAMLARYLKCNVSVKDNTLFYRGFSYSVSRFFIF